MSDAKPWGVIDTLAHTGPRRHDVIVKMLDNGDAVTRGYSLGADKPTEMPEAHAMQFLRDPAFHVFDADGKKVDPVPTTKTGAEANVNLSENELVATYDELSREAIWKRAKILAGSEDFHQKTPTVDLIDFLKKHAKPKVGVARGSEGIKTEDINVVGDSPMLREMKKAA